MKKGRGRPWLLIRYAAWRWMRRRHLRSTNTKARSIIFAPLGARKGLLKTLRGLSKKRRNSSGQFSYSKGKRWHYEKGTSYSWSVGTVDFCRMYRISFISKLVLGSERLCRYLIGSVRWVV